MGRAALQHRRGERCPAVRRTRPVVRSVAVRTADADHFGRDTMSPFRAPLLIDVPSFSPLSRSAAPPPFFSLSLFARSPARELQLSTGRGASQRFPAPPTAPFHTPPRRPLALCFATRQPSYAEHAASARGVGKESQAAPRHKRAASLLFLAVLFVAAGRAVVLVTLSIRIAARHEIKRICVKKTKREGPWRASFTRPGFSPLPDSVRVLPFALPSR